MKAANVGLVSVLFLLCVLLLSSVSFAQATVTTTVPQLTLSSNLTYSHNLNGSLYQNGLTLWWYGGVAPFQITIYSGFSPSCMSDTNVSYFMTTPNGWGSQLTTAFFPAHPTYYCGKVVDSAGNYTYSNTLPIPLGSTPTTTISTSTTVTTTTTIAPASASLNLSTGQNLSAGKWRAQLVGVAQAANGTISALISIYYNNYQQSYMYVQPATIAIGSNQSFNIGTSDTLWVKVNQASVSPKWVKVTLTDYSPSPVTITSTSVPTTTTIQSSSLTNPTLNVSQANLDLGYTTYFTSSWSGGTPPYTVTLVQTQGLSYCSSYVVQAYNVPLSSSYSTSVTYQFKPISTGMSYYCIKVADSAGHVAYSAQPYTILQVQQNLATPTISVNRTSLGLGTSITISTKFSGGTPPYSVYFLQATSPSGCAYSSSKTVFSTYTSTTTSFTRSGIYPSSIGTYYYCVLAEDSAGIGYYSNVTKVNVSAALNSTPLNVGITASANTGPPSYAPINLSALPPNTYVLLTPSWSGGTIPYNLTVLSGTSPSCQSDASAFSTIDDMNVSGEIQISLYASSSSYFCAKMVDAAGHVVYSQSILLTVPGTTLQPTNPAPHVSLSAANGLLTVELTGGVPPYHIIIYNGASSSCSTGASVVGSFNDSEVLPYHLNSFQIHVNGTSANYCAKVTDSLGNVGYYPYSGISIPGSVQTNTPPISVTSTINSGSTTSSVSTTMPQSSSSTVRTNLTTIPVTTVPATPIQNSTTISQSQNNSGSGISGVISAIVNWFKALFKF